MPDAENEINQLLLERHHINTGEPPDFDVQNTTQIANVFAIVTGTLTMMLASIAAISLIVGGVGIMNIMLVSVTERTREIGIRMAVGAQGRDILLQFLTEAITLSIIGGVIGIALGVGTSRLLATKMNWPTLTSPSSILIAFFFSAAVGVFFGFYPARKASHLDPIDALRYE